MKPEKQWWDTSVKKVRGHSIEFLEKQAERAENIELGYDKFDLANRPHFLPLPEDWMHHKHLNVPRGRNKHSALETSLVRLAKQVAPVLAAPEPKKKIKTLVAGNDGYFTVDKIEKIEERIVEIPEED